MLTYQPPFIGKYRPVKAAVSGRTGLLPDWLTGLLRRKAGHHFVLLRPPADYERRRAPFLGRAL